jgi:hypothetical protein
MAKRFTDTEKWADPWFSELSLSAKVLFCFLCDQCDMAGFYERNDRHVSFYTGIHIESIKDAFKELEKSVLLRDRWVFVKNFLRHQKNLPLNPNNNAHKAAIKSLNSKQHLFSDVYKQLEFSISRGSGGASQGLARVTGIGKGKDKGKGLSLSLKPLATNIPEDLKENEKEIIDWLEYKKEMGKSYKPKGLEALWRKIRTIPKENRKASIEHCMASGWSGLFEKKGDNNGQRRNDGQSNKTNKFDGVAEIVEL